MGCTTTISTSTIQWTIWRTSTTRGCSNNWPPATSTSRPVLARGRTAARPTSFRKCFRGRASRIISTIGGRTAGTTGLSGNTRCANTSPACSESSGHDFPTLTLDPRGDSSQPCSFFPYAKHPNANLASLVSPKREKQKTAAGVKQHLQTKFRHTGAIWKKAHGLRSRTVRNVCRALKRAYGTPRLGNPTDPLHDLVFITLSNKTGPRIARQTYRQLRERFHTWEHLLTAPISEVRHLLKHAGLSSVKSKQLRAAIRSIKNHLGTCDLKVLRNKSEKEAETFLVSL